MEFLENALESLLPNDPQTYFYIGIALSFSFWLTVRFFLFLRSDKRTKGFYVSGENGDLLIQDSAISDFIVRVLAGRVDVLVNKVFLKRKSNNYELSILVSLTPGAYVEETLSQVHNIIFDEITTRLGIKNLTHVHVTIKDFSTKERSLKRQSSKALPIVEEAEKA